MRWYNSYRWWWSRFGGRQWTYIIRDTRQKYPTPWMLGVMVVSATIGHYCWSWVLLIAFGVLLVGILWGHLFWGNKYIPNQQLGETRLRSYLAGVFDGEGSIIIKVKRRAAPYHCLQISVSNTNQEAVLEFKNEFGGYIWQEARHTFANKCVWIWSTTDSNAQKCLESLLPFLKVKRNEADLALDFSNKRLTLTLEEKEQYRLQLHSLKGNNRPIKDLWGTRYVPDQGKGGKQ